MSRNTHKGFGPYMILSLANSQTGTSFEGLLVGGLIHAGVNQANVLTNIGDDQTKTTFDIVVLSKKRNRPVFINAKTSLRERWKIEDRDVANLREDRRSCGTRIYAQLNKRFGLHPGTIRPSKSDEAWVVFHRERANATAAQSIAHANNIGGQLTGIDRDHFITVFDSQGMDRLLDVCL